MAESPKPFALLAAAAIMSALVVPIAFSQKWFDRNPNVVPGLLLVVMLLCFWAGATSGWFRSRITKYRERRPVLSLTILVSIGTLLGAALGVAAWWGIRKNEQHLTATKASADAAPRQDPQIGAPPPTPAFREKADTVIFTLGGMSVGQSIGYLRVMAYTPFNFQGYTPVITFPTDDSYRFRFTIWTQHGEKSPIVVDGDEFTVTPPPGWDRNFNANALEVVNERGEPVFQMIRRTPTHIVIHGVLPRPDGGYVLAWEGKAINRATDVPPDFNLKPIFKYPSWKFLGTYAD